MVKDQEYLKKKASYCLGLAKKLGATDTSVIVKNSVSETVNFRNKKLDESNRSDDLGLSITTYIGKKKSSISSSNLLNDNLNILIEKCIETTKNTPEDEFNSLPDRDLFAKEVKDLNLYDENHIENNQKIEYLKKLEAAASNDKKIVNGKIGSPIKGATLIGDGPSILKEVSMVGNDMMMDPGIGTCGKAGQGVPVGVAQPSILINKMTVGGTKL